MSNIILDQIMPMLRKIVDECHYGSFDLASADIRPEDIGYHRCQQKILDIIEERVPRDG
jgi:hypothetical protein